jgi:hypothetical protein
MPFPSPLRGESFLETGVFTEKTVFSGQKPLKSGGKTSDMGRVAMDVLEIIRKD